MKWFLLLFILASLQADRLKIETIACQNLKDLQNISSDIANDFIALNKYAMTHNCEFLSLKDKISVQNYQEDYDKSFIKIYVSKSGNTLYVRKKVVQIEQSSGKYNNIKF